MLKLKISYQSGSQRQVGKDWKTHKWPKCNWLRRRHTECTAAVFISTKIRAASHNPRLNLKKCKTRCDGFPPQSGLKLNVSN